MEKRLADTNKAENIEESVETLGQKSLKDHVGLYSRIVTKPIKETFFKSLLSKKRDLYNNQVCNNLQTRFNKRKTSINVIGLFEPGELLKSINNQ